jgi:hypothetical protein
VTGFDDLYFIEGDTVAVFHHDETCGDSIAEQIFERRRHARARLAAARNQDAIKPAEIIAAIARTQTIAVEFYVGLDRCVRIRRRQRGSKDISRLSAKFG